MVRIQKLAAAAAVGIAAVSLWASNGQFQTTELLGAPGSTQPRFGVATIQGRRSHQEDRYIAEEWLRMPKGAALYGVFDGHGGHLCSDFARDNFADVFQDSASWDTALDRLDRNETLTERVFRSTCAELDTMFFARFEGHFKQSPRALRDGSTATVALVTPQTIYSMNLGDSRTILGSGGEGGGAVELCRDHTPHRPDEQKRIEALGGVIGQVPRPGSVKRIYIPDVGGGLAVSRGLGDFFYKLESHCPNGPLVSIVPECRVIPREKDHEFLVLASDGLWDAVSNQEAYDKVYRSVRKLGMGLEQAADALVQHAYTKGSSDNITVMIVDLRANPAAAAAAKL